MYRKWTPRWSRPCRAGRQKDSPVTQVSANGIGLEVDVLGRPGDPVVLLIMGLGMQLVAWPDAFCQSLVEAGYQVVRFDNRDVGLSEKFDSAMRVNLPLASMRYFLRLPVAAPYQIDAMAADAVGVLDALGIESAHIIGASLGGMVAQSVAAQNPERCLSLVSIMSSSGDRRMPPADLKVIRLLLNRPRPGCGTDDLVDHFTRIMKTIGSPGYPTPDAELRATMRVGVERCYHPEGTARQLLAVIASGDRSSQLRGIARPSLVLHGDSDPLIPLPHGLDCARKIPGAVLKVIPGMGHDLAPGLVPILSDAVIAHLAAVRARSATRH